MAINHRALNFPSGIGNLVAVCAIKMRPDYLLCITDHSKVGIMRDHDDLPTLLRLGKNRHEKAYHGFVVKVLFRLIKDYRVSSLIHQ
ncbi:hypothetical protein D9M69_569560 [compost metagenome]